jgi:ligand-binding sensor domain-containing protein
MNKNSVRQDLALWLSKICCGMVFVMLGIGNSALQAQVLPTKNWDMRDEFKNYIHESWSVEQGLPQDVVTAITQTPDGYLWMGTQTGLVRFNGVTFRKQDRYNTPAMKSDFIRQLTVADDSTMWIGTDQGGVLSQLHDKITAHNPSDSASVEGTRVIIAGKNHIIWAAIPGSGVWKRVDGHWHAVSGGRPLTSTWAAYEDADGSLWIGEDGALGHLTDTSAVWYDATEGMPKAQVYSLLRDVHGTLLIGTRQQGLYTLRNGRIIPLASAEELKHSIISAMCRDHDGGVWIGTVGKGLYYYNGTTIRACFSNVGHPSLQVRSLFEDNEGNVWIGTHGDGLHRLRKSVVHYVKITEPGVSPEVWSVLMSHQGTWIGTRNNGIRRINGDRIERPVMPPKLSTMTVGALAEEPGGILWIGGEFGLFRKAGGRIDEIKMPDGRSFKNAFAMIRDQQGVLWIGGQGLFKIIGGTVTKIEGMPPGISINFLLEDTKGRLWIGSDGNGVGLYAQNKVTFYSTDSGLTSNTILCLYEDPQGGMCAGTQGGGLNRFKNGRWGSVTMKQGLLDNFVNTIIPSNDGTIWMSTDRGLFGTSEQAIIDVTEGRSGNLDGISIDSRDGLQSTEFGGGLQSCSARSKDGMLWFVSLKGLVGYDPRVAGGKIPPPPVNIELIEADGQSVEMRDGVQVGPGLRTIRFEYAGLNYIVPTATQYKYFLEGYDTQWINASSQREATYTNLSPGVYTFHVTAASKEGAWNDQGASVRIVILPHFWQTSLFKIFCFFALIGMVYSIYRVRVWQMLKTEEKLHHRIDEAVAKIKVLQGLIPMCSNCKKIRDDKGYWNDVSKYLREHTDAELSHGICPECAEELYGEQMKRIREKSKGNS